MADPEWEKLKEFFHSALALPPKDRPAYLDQACAGDAFLRQSVEALLKSHEESGFVDEPAYAAAANLIVDDQQIEQHPEAGVFQAGQKIGRYRINSLLGEGGMGRVYLAEDTKLRRKVSLKFLSKAITRDHEKLLRFEQEARAASALNHPNILTIYEFGEDDGQQFIATEFVAGQTLRERLQRPIELDEALEIAIQITSALVAAHRVNIVHRDIKPDNVIIRKDDRLVKVLDFGLAKILTTRTLAATLNGEAPIRFKTGPGVVIGTAAYMSPEQARGDEVDERSDIWSLGVVLYEMITGSTPFVAETSNEIIAGIVSRQRAAPLSRFTHEVPERLQEIVDKVLTKDRDERYQTSKDLLIDLRRLKQSLELKAGLDGRSDTDSASAGMRSVETVSERAAAPTAYPTSSAEYIVNQVKSHKRVAIAVIALIAIAAVGIVGAGISAYKSRQPQLPAIGFPAINSIAVLPFVNGNADADTEFLSDGLTDNLIDRLSQIRGLRVMSHTAVFHYKGRETDPFTIGNELGVEAVLSGRLTKRNDVLNITLELVNAKDNSHIWGEQYDRKLSDLLALQREIPFDVSEKLRVKLSGESKERLSRPQTDNLEAYQLYLKGIHSWEKWTQSDAKEAAEFFDEAIKKDPNYALAYSGLAAVYVNFGNGVGPDVPPKEAHRRAREAATKALSLDPELGEAHAAMAHVFLYDDWDFTGAERELRRAIELSPSYAEGHHAYSHLLLLLGRFDESFAESKRLLELDPVSETSIGHLAYHYLYARRFDEAIEQYKKDRQLYPDVDFANNFKLGEAYSQKGMFDEAIPQFLKGFAGFAYEPAKIEELKKAYAKSGIKGFYQKLLEQDLGAPQAEQNRLEIAELYARLGKKDEAFEWLEKAYVAHDDQMVRLKEELGYDNLRSDPRYVDLLRRVGLPQ